MKKNFLTFLSLVVAGSVDGQSLMDNLTLSSYSNQTNIQALKSITLTNGFYIPAPAAGKTVTISIAGFQNIVSAPTAGQNYILTRTFRDTVKLAQLGSLRTIGQENQSIQYFDGLGRPSQTVQLMASPTYKDIIQHIEYDGFGRESTTYLPYGEKSGNGSFRSGAKTTQSDFYKDGIGWDAATVKTPNPYAITVFENSPLNRVLEKGAPGAAWQPLPAPGTGHTVKTSYGTNTAMGLDVVKLWTVTASGASGTTNYSAGKLYRTTVRDENSVNTTSRSGSVDEYKDFEGRVILKRVWESESKALNTYYVYDDFGDLRYVIPPAVTGTGISELSTEPTFTNFDNYVYAYKYDGRRRLIKKKIPGKGWEYLVYNKNDQVVFTRDAEQLKREEWSFTKYDAFGRVVMTGVEKGHVGDNHDDLQQALADFTGPMWEQRGSVMEGYTNNTIPQNTENLTILEVNYYDDYAFAGATVLPVSGVTRSTKIKSLQTGTKVYRTDGTQPLLTVLYYDDYGRVIQSASKNHLGGTDYVTNTYNFPGELLTSTRVHTPATGSATTIVTTNEYDHVGRLVSTKEKIGSQAEVILASNSYNEIGQLKSKAVGKSGTETSFVNTTTYSYNERGWLSKSTSPKFSQQLKYQDGTNPQWNGNISQQLWGDDATLPYTFSYQYDKLNRLTSGTNGQTGTASIAEVITYDDLGMGNIKTLKRDALTATTYTYTGNKLMSLSGGLTGSYTYDANGSVKTDRMGMAITYNYLNLPQTAKKTGVDVAFLYDAMGTKLQKLSKIGTAPNVITTTRDYVGGIEYNNGAIDIIHNSEGYAQRNGANYVYHYNLTDHLGNVRATLKRGSSPTAVDVAQRDNYYPFGKRKVVAGGNNQYLYNGKEIQGELGDQYDYGARFYDAEIGRWNVIDPMAEQYRRWSPYTYGVNNPMRFIDPDGMRVDDYEIYDDGRVEVTRTKDKTNTYTYHDADGATRDLGTYNKRDIKDSKGNTVELVDLSTVDPSLLLITDNAKAQGSTYLQEDFAAAVLGAAGHFTADDLNGMARNYGDYGLQTTQLTDKNGKHSGHGGKLGEYADIRYGSSYPSMSQAIWVGDKNYSEYFSNQIVKSLSSLGFNNPYSILTENSSGNGPALPRTNFVAPKNGQNFHHKHHMHIQKLNKSKFSFK
ncbi:DUF6443 domain-containing protein [Sphingobacterium sp. 2149]|uniref:DUF6443 domain-containing protein n=1 Tax=Sphingobacterium sp. 2149 TaxID=2817763 RepID=UPI001AE7DA48|nr:DUF6443 domain-containing protein [Sphingobacterium sp. 2149]MDR6735528.1 RHS repeat-associated protein [Sphingobacterium sp. 2149]